MLSQLVGVPLRDIEDEKWEEFHAEISASWSYWLEDCETFDEYLKVIKKKEAVMFGLSLGSEWVGFLCFCYDTMRSKWTMEYLVTKKRRGMGLTKLILPTVSHAFESLGKKLGLRLRGNNEIGQLAATRALGVAFPKVEPHALLIVDLAPWTWGNRYHISDRLVVALTTEFIKYPQ